jgi:hypothetical protein
MYIYISVSVKNWKCKCKWFTLTLDLHVVYTAIDTYTHKTGLDTLEMVVFIIIYNHYMLKFSKF